MLWSFPPSHLHPPQPDRLRHRVGAVLGVSTVWGFLSNAGVVPSPPLFLVFPLFCLAWGFSQPIIRRRYQ